MSSRIDFHHVLSRKNPIGMNWNSEEWLDKLEEQESAITLPLSDDGDSDSGTSGVSITCPDDVNWRWTHGTESQCSQSNCSCYVLTEPEESAAMETDEELITQELVLLDNISRGLDLESAQNIFQSYSRAREDSPLSSDSDTNDDNSSFDPEDVDMDNSTVTESKQMHDTVIGVEQLTFVGATNFPSPELDLPSKKQKRTVTYDFQHGATDQIVPSLAVSDCSRLSAQSIRLIRDFFIRRPLIQRESCHQFVAKISNWAGEVVPAEAQFMGAYTVELRIPEQMPAESMTLFQVRDLDLDRASFDSARTLYGRFVPEVEYLGQLEDTTLSVWKFVCPAGRPLAATSVRSTLRQDRPLYHDILRDFIVFVTMPLRGSRPSLDPWPTVLHNCNLTEMNIMISSECNKIACILDWTQTVSLPFGASLCGVQALLAVPLYYRWHYNHTEPEDLFRFSLYQMQMHVGPDVLNEVMLAVKVAFILQLSGGPLLNPTIQEMERHEWDLVHFGLVSCRGKARALPRARVNRVAGK